MNLSVIGMVFPVALLMGYFAGRYLGGLLGNASLGAMIGALLGIVSGFYNIFKMMARYTSSSSPADAATSVSESRDGTEMKEPE